MSAALILAWLLPPIAGIAAWLAISPRRGPGWLAAAFGYGLVLGLLLAGAATALFARADTTHALHVAAPWLALFAVGAAGAAWWRWHPITIAAGPAVPGYWWIDSLLGLALASLAWRGWIALREILLRPTFPWDAWDAWAVKSKTWYLLGHYTPFVSMTDWLAHPTATAHTGIAWAYPATLAWMQVWFASAAGGWIEPMVNLPWLALWIGLLCGHYGQWRALGLRRVPALAAVYVLGALPLLDVHVALAGYADLWLATIFGFGVLAWLRWIEQRDRGQLAIAIICAVLLPLIKLEGSVWLLLFACVAGFGALPRRWRWYAVAVAAIVLGAGVAFGHLVLPLLTLGWLHVDHGVVQVPVFGAQTIGWHGAALDGIVYSLFAQQNWNLLWWLAPLVVLWRWRALRAHDSLRLLGLLLLAGIAFLVFLFVFTDAARWAESYTAINRLVMHMVPAVVSLLALLFRDVDLDSARADTNPAPAA